MELFSHREGYKKKKEIIQTESIDDDIKNKLWNLLCLYYFHSERPSVTTNWDNFLRILWFNYFKKTFDEILDLRFQEIYRILKDYFYTCEWNENYDFIEFIANNYPNNTTHNQEFINLCNAVFEEELSGYRFLNGKIIKMTSKIEISEVEDAIENTIKIKNVNTHLKSAIDLITDRKNPDYRNSIKESISAVEALSQLISNNKKSTLNKALEILNNKIKIHPALKDAFIKLYGYTSDAEGIRHALLEESNLDFEDAKFMLVACTSFINYLLSKASKASINF
jgi:2-hydroxy-3-keto-5-methylthiopentenyl-1-phosphate phosphatase